MQHCACGIKGRNETDHNTITLDMNIEDIEKRKKEKKTDWNIKAPDEKWLAFGRILQNKSIEAENILRDRNKTIDTRYKQWFNIIENKE